MNRNELLIDVLLELQKVQVNVEITTYELVERVNDKYKVSIHDMSLLMWLHAQVIKNAKKYGVIIDHSIHNDEILGLPYHIGFLVKENKHA